MEFKKNDRIKKLDDSTLAGVSAGFDTNPPLNTALLTDENIIENKEEEHKNEEKKHEIE